jgi:hypothetical protein
MSHAFGTIEELGEGYGFRKVRQALGVEAFGVNVVVMPPNYPGFHHYHDEQDELYFVHSGTARVEVGDEDLVMLVVCGKGGYVGRDGHMVDEADAERRAGFGSGASGSSGSG